MNQSRQLPRCIRSALVTGASGFVGSYLVRQLAENGVRTRALIRSSPGLLSMEGEPVHGSVEIFTGDISDPDSLAGAVEGCDTVFHVAAVLGPAHLPLETYRRINAGGTSNVIRACRRCGGVERMVHVSSTGAIGPVPPHQVACEGTPPRPEDKYEITKLEGEEIALQASREGFPAVIARPAWVYGPGDARTLKLFRMIARRRFLLVGKARNKQHPVWIHDLVQGLLRCATVPGIEGRVYHLAGPEIMTVETLCRTAARAAGVSILPLRPPLWLAGFPGYLVEAVYSFLGGEPPIDHRKVNFFRVNRAYSILRAREDLEWEPRMTFEEGVRLTIEWYRRHHRIP